MLFYVDRLGHVFGGRLVFVFGGKLGLEPRLVSADRLEIGLGLFFLLMDWLLGGYLSLFVARAWTGTFSADNGDRTGALT
jgi:hypothetical protein